MSTEVETKERATRVEQIEYKGVMVWRYSDGSLRHDNGQLAAKAPGGAPPITSENAREMHALRRLRGLEAQMRGMAKGAGVNILDGDLVSASAAALETYTEHLGSTYLKSNSIRGLSEAYDKLATVLVGDRREKQEETVTSEQPSILILIHEWHAARTEPSRPDNVIDASFTDDTYTKPKQEDAE